MRKKAKLFALCGLVAHLTCSHAATGIADSVSGLKNSATNPTPGGFVLKNNFITANILQPHLTTAHHHPMINSLSIVGVPVIPQDNAGAEFAFALRSYNGSVQISNPTAGGDCAGNASNLLDFQFDSATLNQYINYLPSFNKNTTTKIPGSPAMGMLLKIQPREYGGDSTCGYNSSANYQILPSAYPSRIDLLDSNLPFGTPLERYRSDNTNKGKLSNYIFETGFVLGSDGSSGVAYPDNGIHPLSMLVDLTIKSYDSALATPSFHRRHVEVPSIFVTDYWKYAYYGTLQGTGAATDIVWNPMIMPSSLNSMPTNDASKWVNMVSWDFPSLTSGVNLVALCNTYTGNGETCVALFSMKPVFGTVSNRPKVPRNLIQLSMTGGNMNDFNTTVNGVSSDVINLNDPKTPSLQFRRMIAFGNVATIRDAIRKSILAGHFNGYN